MKHPITSLAVIALILFLTSCETKDENPFIGSWENTEITVLGPVVVTLTFTADLKMTMAMEVTVNDITNTTSADYTYSFTDAQITVQEAGNPEETTDYMTGGNSLVLSFGGMGLTTFTKNNSNYYSS
jgi:hypothetical protein